jgi:protein involved in polysaccharide export with SLBB domain
MEIAMKKIDRLHSRRSKTFLAFLYVLGLTTLHVVSGCSSSVAVPPLDPTELSQLEAAGNFPHQNYRFEPGDTLQMRYTFHPDMNQEVIVLPDGKILAHLVGEITVAGMTATQLERLLVERTSDRLRDPEVVVSVNKFAEKGVYVGGEVGKPGILPYRKGLSPLQAIIASGGFLDSARKDSVILVRTGGSENNFISRKLNLEKTVNDGVREPIYLAPHDVIYVPKTAIADANLWVKQYITDLLPLKAGTVPYGAFLR